MKVPCDTNQALIVDDERCGLVGITGEKDSYLQVSLQDHYTEPLGTISFRSVSRVVFSDAAK
jgi:hypothetical protein